MIKRVIKKLVNKLGYEIKSVDHIGVLYQVDSFFNCLYSKAQVGTQMESTDNALRRQRHYVLNHLLRNADLGKGDVCEAGCWRGLSAYQIASYLKSEDVGTVFHIFDSFEGLSEITSVDRSEYDKRKSTGVREHFSCSQEDVQNNLKEFNFIKYYRGWIPERFSEVENRCFSFVHIDVDLYQPIKSCFEFFYPRLSPGGIMVFDDYGCVQFPGAKKAIDECISKQINNFFLPLASGQAFLIKN